MKNEFLEIFGLEYNYWDKPLYNKYAEKLKNDADKLRMVWNVNNGCNDYGINAMFKSRNISTSYAKMF